MSALNMNRHEILEAASDAVKDREGSYGAPEDVHSIWAHLIEPVVGRRVTPAEALWMMMQLKAARLALNIGHQDSWVDAAGYASLGGEVSERMSISTPPS